MSRIASAALSVLVAAAVGCTVGAADGTPDGPDDPGRPDGGGGSPNSDAGTSPGTPDARPIDPAAPDPLELAAQVSQSELTRTIQDLQDLGSRYTYGGGDELARDYLVGRLADYGLAAELDPFDVGVERPNNIIARLPGVGDPSVVYIFSAHYDSTSNDATSQAPGADDNATGVAAVLEAARILASHDFDYTLWFVFTAAEEQGSRGSEHMVQWLASDGVDVRGVIAPDMIGYWPLGDADSFDILGDTASQHLVEQMAGIADALGVANKTWIQHGYCYGDDHTNFQEAGSPAISPMDCVEAHNVTSSGESTPHYHKTTDTLSTLHMHFTTRVTGVLVGTFATLGQPTAD